MDLADLVESWELHLRSERKSAQTVKSYGHGVRAYLSWCAAPGKPVTLDRRQMREFIDGLLTAGAKPATARARHLAVRRFSAWLAEQGKQDTDPLLGLRPPKLDKPVVEPLTDNQVRAMLKMCRGLDLRDRRDTAILLLMFTTGMRAGEVVALTTGDVDLRSNPPTAIVRRGKGGKGRVVPLAAR